MGTRLPGRGICGARAAASPAACSPSTLGPSPTHRHAWSSRGCRHKECARARYSSHGRSDAHSRGSSNPGADILPGVAQALHGSLCWALRTALWAPESRPGSPPWKQDKKAGLGVTHPGLSGTCPVKPQGEKAASSVPASTSSHLGEAPPGMD